MMLTSSRKKHVLTAITVAISSFSGVCLSEPAVVGVSQQAQNKQSLPRPAKGMSKTQVSQQFGQPNSTEAAVGQPPISVWIYPEYSVYLEYDHVIHTVLQKQK